MQPNQPTPPTQAPAPNPYDFIMNPQEPQKQSLFNFSGKKSIFILLGGGIFVIIIIFMLFSLLFGGSGANGEKLLEIAQTQTEIIRLTEDARNKARSSTTQNLANTVNMSVTTSKNDLLPIVKKNGGKTDAKLLVLKKSSKADAQLAAALQSNQYDSVFITIITAQLQEYQKQLKDMYPVLSKPADKQVIKTAYDGTTLILTNVKTN